MVDSEEQAAVVPMPLGRALVRWEREDLQIVAVWVSKVERLDASRIGIPIRQTLRACGRMLDFGAAQPGIRSLHIAHDDRDVLERVIVSAHVRGNWSSPRCQELHELQMLFSKSQPHQPQAQAEKAEQLL